MRFDWHDTVYWLSGVVFVSIIIWMLWIVLEAPAGGPIEINMSAVMPVGLGLLFVAISLGFGAKEYFFGEQPESISALARIFLPREIVFSIIAGIFLLGVYALISSFEHLFVLKSEFDRINVTEVRGDSGQENHSILLEFEPMSYSRYGNVMTRSRGPFQAHLCKLYDTDNSILPQRATILRLVNGKLAEQKKISRFKDYWTQYEEGECLVEAFQLDGIFMADARYCIDLELRERGELRVERSCWDFKREVGEETLTLSEVFRD